MKKRTILTIATAITLASAFAFAGCNEKIPSAQTPSVTPTPEEPIINPPPCKTFRS